MMVTLPPYIPEYQSWRLLPYEYRWIFDKIELGRRLGYDCGPVGMRMKEGVYCVRPTINLQGCATGGFRRVVIERDGEFIKGPVGHCYSPWSDEPRRCMEYVADECWFAQEEVRREGQTEYFAETDDRPELPEPLRGISRYMYVEMLGDMVIDVGPRHILEEMRQETIDDYKQFDPDYEPPVYARWGLNSSLTKVWDEKLKAWRIDE